MSSEVGSGHISVFPVMTGFKGKVTRETKEAGAAGARTFATGFKGAGATAGRTLGRDLKSSLSSAAGDLGAAELRTLKSGVASAAAALSKARLRQQDEAGRVRVAETRLQEAIARSGEGSSQAVAAEERLASMRRLHGVATDSVTAATDRLKTAQDALASAQATIAASQFVVSSGFRGFVNDIRAGWTEARAARSSFTGVAASLAGLARAVLDVTGVSKLARLAAAGVSRAFTSVATMVGGGIAKAWAASKSLLGSIAQTVQGAFGPMVQYLGSVGTLIASPFVRLGTQVASWLSPVTTQVRGLFSKIGTAIGPAFESIGGAVRAAAGPIRSAAVTAFQSVVGAASRAAAAAGHALGAGLQSTATGAVTTAAAGIAIAFGKGFARLTAIDTAQAKLRGLGNDAGTVSAIMSDALVSVKGTSFGLGEAATVAAAAVAANIRPGEALQGHLKRIANNAAAAGLSMQDMGSIFNKAATQANGVQNDVLSQLADKGIPIYQALADQMGVTAGEVFKMASDGKVDFETFSRAAEAAAGTVSQEIGKTVPGAAKNFMAAMGRIGANALSGVYGKIAPLISAATSALGPIETKARAFGDVLVKVLGPAMDFVTNLFNKIGDGSLVASEGFKSFLPILGPLAGAFTALGAGGLAGLLTRIPILGGMLGGLTGPLAALGGPLGIAAAAFAGFLLSGGDAAKLVDSVTGVVDQVIAALPRMVGAVARAVPDMVGAIVSQIPTLLSAATGIVNALVEGIVFAIPVLAAGAVQLLDGLLAALLANLPLIIQAAVSLVGALVEGLVAAVPALAEAALTLLSGLITAIVANLPLIINAAIQLVLALIQGIVTAVPLLINGALQLVTGLLSAIVAALPMIIEGGVKLLMALVLGLVQALPMLLTAGINLVLGLLQAIIDNLPMIIDAGIQLLMSLITGLIDMLPTLITTAVTLVLQLVAGLIQMLPELIGAGIQLIVALVGGLAKAIPKIIQMLPQIVKAIWDGLADVDWLGLGAQIIQGLIDGFFSMVGAVGDAIGSVLGGILDFFPHSPAKRGPLSARGWSQLKTSGAATMEQFIDGAKAEAPAFGDSLAAAAASASQRARAAVTAVAPSGAGEQPNSSAGATEGAPARASVTQNIRFENTDPRIAMRQLGREAERAFGAT